MGPRSKLLLLKQVLALRKNFSSGENALPLKVGRRPLLHGGFVCESRYFRLDYKTQNVPSLQVRAVMEKCNRFFFFWVGFATQILRAVHTRTTGSGTRARVVRTGFRPGSDTRVVVGRAMIETPPYSSHAVKKERF